MTLHLRLRTATRIPLEVEGATPDALRDKSLKDIQQSEIFHGNTRVPLAEFFDVSGDPSDSQMEWEGDLAGVHWIGAKMQAGTIRVQGNAGRHLGSEMRGGAIFVEGHAGDWVGAELHGGLIHVRGGAGHLVGAAYRGSARGMTRGTILVDGDAGNEIGHTMRRGLIAIGGNIGDLAGFNLLAGTIFVFGSCGIRHGANMRRGTLCFVGELPPLLPSFRYACRYRPEALQLIFSLLRSLDFQVSEDVLRSPVDLYNGDMTAGGRGEMLLRAML